MVLSTERPIFVIGSQRSGTTLLRYALTSHPRIYIPPESNFLPRFFSENPTQPFSREKAVWTIRTINTYVSFFKDWKEPLLDPDSFVDDLPDLMPATIINGLYSRYAQQHGAVRWGDKTPLYMDWVDLFAEIYPDAQFVHMIRDGRDACISMMKAYNDARFFYYDLYYSAYSWKRRVLHARESGRKLGSSRYYELHYEQFVAEPERYLREICDFLGESFEPDMLEPHKTAAQSFHSTGIHASTRKPISTNMIGKWRREMTPKQMRIFQRIAGDLLEEFGYETPDLGKMSLLESADYVRLNAKYHAVALGRYVVKKAGIFHPTDVLERVFPTYMKTPKVKEQTYENP